MLTPILLSDHQCIASPSTDVDPALVPPICAVMKTGSLKALCVGGLRHRLTEQVLEELPHCTQLRELRLKLERSDKVRCQFCMQCSINIKIILYMCTCTVRYAEKVTLTKTGNNFHLLKLLPRDS